MLPSPHDQSDQTNCGGMPGGWRSRLGVGLLTQTEIHPWGSLPPGIIGNQNAGFIIQNS